MPSIKCKTDMQRSTKCDLESGEKSTNRNTLRNQKDDCIQTMNFTQVFDQICPRI